MKIAICSSSVPFVQGGYRNIVEWLHAKILEQGHQVEILYIPQDDQAKTHLQQFAMYRLVDLAQSADRIICFRPFSYAIPHDHKIVWFIHHLRIFYDLWDSKLRGFPDDVEHRNLRDTLRGLDTAALVEARSIYTNSRIIGERLKFYNGLDSEILYPPLYNPENYRNLGQNDEIACVCRIEEHKRQHLLVEAMRHTRTPVRLRLSGRCADAAYGIKIRQLIAENGLENRVSFENRWISDQEKFDTFAHCLASAYLPMDEDSFGYPTLEAAHSFKPTLTAIDSGGVLEFVEDGGNGFVCQPDPADLANRMDQLYSNRKQARELGIEAHQKIGALRISWDNVMEKLLK